MPSAYLHWDAVLFAAVHWDAISTLRQFTVLPRFVEVKRTSGEAVGYAVLTRTGIDGPILPCFTTRMVGCARRLRLDCDDTLDLDRDLVWQHDVADRGAGMPSGFTEHFDK